MRVAVLGGGGVVGRAVVERLEARGIAWVDVGRDDPTVPGAAEVVLCAAGGDLDTTRELVTAAVRDGTDVVDVDHEVGYLHWLATRVGPTARDTGARILGGAGLRWAVGDLLSALAAEPVPDPQEVHVAYTSGGSRRHLTPGERRAAVAGLALQGSALEAGRVEPEPPGGRRRLAWFPRPVGPSHAAAVPGGEALTVPRHLRSVRTVHTYQAMPGWRAELLQARSSVASSATGRRWLQRRLARQRRVAGAAAWADEPWGCVAEVAGDRRLGRAWAYGRAPVGISAEIAVELALRLSATTRERLAGGAVAPSEVAVPGALLDAVADRSGLRWSRSSTILEGR
ncbi:MAG: hypothetical protein ACQEUI_07755 [Actinomycetota bacterium]